MKIRNLTLGEGMPKICVPVMGKTKAEIEDSIKNAMEYQPDMVEWRGDHLEILGEKEAIREMEEILGMLRTVLEDTPLLFTIRTKAEGGEQELPLQTYVDINRSVIASGMADAVDVEVFLGEDMVKELVGFAHAHGVKVIGSNHDFKQTPEEEEITSRLCTMQELGCDVAKIAVMPQSGRDVLKLLSATETMKRCYPSTPVITMAMGSCGMISRLSGEVFGSALTFGMAGKASAPGQIPVEELRKILLTLHQQ